MLAIVEQSLVQRLLEVLAVRGATLAVAEGDTGGVLLEWLTALPGSSRVVLGGVVAYHDDLKRALLGVSPAIFEQHGAVSAAAAEAMARGVRRLTAAGAGDPRCRHARIGRGQAYVAVVNADRALVREHH